MQPPDAAWLPLIKLLFGCALLLILAILVGMIALGNVRQETSYGLMPLITTLATLGGAFANWAFGKKD